MTKKQKRKLFEIILGTVFLGAAFISSKLLSLEFPLSLIVYLPAYAVAGYDVLRDAAVGIFAGDVFGENTLMSIASVGALAIGEYPEAVFVMLFYKVGTLFENIAVGKSRNSIRALVSMKPVTANVECEGGEVERPIEDVQIGDVVIVRPGERLPVDGVVVKGESTIDTSALTGEALPVFVGEGTRVLSGSINKSGVIAIKVDTVFAESTVSMIVALVENSSCTKAKSEKFITKFSKYYTPAVTAAALIIAVVPSIVTGEPSEWIRRALIFLVVSCPCALVISVPLSYFAGIGCAAKRGILIKGSDTLEALAKADVFIFDKTGTVTEGNFKVTSIEPVGMSEDELLFLAACPEAMSLHPLAKALVEEQRARSSVPLEAEGFEEIPGMGVVAAVDGARVAAGNRKLMSSLGIEIGDDGDSSCIHVAKNGEYAGKISLEDTPKKNSKAAMDALKSDGCKLYMLSGDRRESAEKIAREVGIDNVECELLPAEKTERLTAIAKASQGLCAFVGDGINDAPSIMASDVGIAMGALGSDLAIECADVVLLDDDPVKVPEVRSLSVRVRKTVIGNIVFALAVKGAVIALGAAGLATMWEAVIADVGVSVIAILNSMRIMKKRKEK